MSDMSAPPSSVWLAGRDPIERSPLRENIEADVCIVGAGIAGLTTAYELLVAAPRSVVVLDLASAVGSGETGHTTAHLSNAIDDRYVELERVLGADAARVAAASHSAAIDRIGAIVAAEEIDCGYQRLDGFLFLAPAMARRSSRPRWPPRAGRGSTT